MSLPSNELSDDVMFGDQVPRICRSPEAPTSAGPEAIALAAEFGLFLDPWQQFVLNESLKETADGKWAAFEVGLMVSRQNGKGSILEAIELAGIFLFGEQLIIHSAHQFKALDVSTPILTERGWTTMGELTNADRVYGPDGKLTGIIAHPIRSERPCYRLTLDDGQEIVADEDHLWGVTYVGNAGSQEYRVVSTREIVEHGACSVAARQGRDRRVYHFRLQLPKPLEMPARELPIDPWLLGAWLGDGTSTKGELTVGAEDLEWLTQRLEAIGERYRVRPDSRWPDRVFTVLIDGLRGRLRDAGVLGDKHIPSDFLLGSIEQRRALLAGLMDTDGTVSSGGAVITLCRENLIDEILILARSLGYKASKTKVEMQKWGAGTYYRVQFRAHTDNTPFAMPRKSARLTERPARPTRASYNAITRVESVPPRRTRCITVDNESRLYLAGSGFIPTHNTSKEAMRRLEFLLNGSGHKYKANRSHGEESLELLSGPNKGARVMFQTRTKAGGLGLSGDRVILDEAMIVSSEAIQALMPTLTSRPNPQIWYTGSAVDQRIHPHCEAFGGIRQRALSSGEAGRLCYLEWSCKEGVDPKSPRERARSNPGIGYRVTHEYIEDEYRSFAGMGDVRAFGVQRLGIGDWPILGDARTEIPAEKLAAMHTPEREYAGRPVVALCRAPEGGPWAIVAAQRLVDGRIHLEVGYCGDDTADEVMRRVVDVVTAWDPMGLIVGRHVDTLTELQVAGVDVTIPTRTEEAQACGGLLNDVLVATELPLLSHANQGGLNNATKQAIRHELSAGGFVWEAVDGRAYAQLMGATLARWGLVKFGGEPQRVPTIHAPTEEEIQAWIRIYDEESSLDDTGTGYRPEMPPRPGDVLGFC